MRARSHVRHADDPHSGEATSRGLLPHVVARSRGGDAESVRQTVGERLAPAPEDAVLELGCGDGRLLLELISRTPRGFVAGVEPEELMRRHAMARTRRFIERGRLRLVGGLSSDLSSFPDGAFDKACAVDVVYFWRRPADDLAEIRRVLRPGGRLLLGYVSSGRRPAASAADIVRSTGEVEGWLREAGFSGVSSALCPGGAARGSMSWTHATRPERSNAASPRN
jgi:SAM-dependent methyltransferase